MNRVLLLGDSFTEAGAVEEEASLRAVLESMLNAERAGSYEVLNGGTVVLMFFSNDLQGNTATKKKPWFEVEGGQLRLRGSPVPAPPEDRRRRSPDPPPHLTPWHGSLALRLLGLRTERANPTLHHWLARAGLVEPPADHPPTRDWLQAYGPDSELTERRWHLTLSLIDALHASVSARGGDLVVFYVPAGFEIHARDWQLTRQRWGLDGEGWDASRVARRLGSACAARGLPFVDPRPLLKRAQEAGRPAYFRHDPHWTAVGHEAAAEALLPELYRRRP